MNNRFPVEPKTTCILCSRSFLARTAEKTGGWCLRHSDLQHLTLGFLSRLECEVDFETVARAYREATQTRRRYWAGISFTKARPVADLRPLWLEYKKFADKDCQHWRFHGAPEDTSTPATVLEGYVAIRDGIERAAIIVRCEPRPRQLLAVERLMRKTRGHEASDLAYTFGYELTPHVISAIASKIFVELAMESRVFELRRRRRERRERGG